MFEMLEKREGKHLFNHGRLVFFKHDRPFNYNLD